MISVFNFNDDVLSLQFETDSGDLRQCECYLCTVACDVYNVACT